MKELSNIPLILPKKRILNRLKIPRSTDVKDYDLMMERFFAHVEPIARFDDMAIEIGKNHMLCVGSYEIHSASLCRHLNGCERVSLLAVTIGPFIEEEMALFAKKNKTLEPFVLDALGSECVEEAAQRVSQIIADEILKKKYHPTKRFSPGYGDLGLGVQAFFFATLRLEEIGMTLNPSFLMLPQKSITAFIGWRNKNQYPVE